jgi:hypothetical protein
VEVRVHGVSGTPPEEMLDIDRVQQVAGDEFGRVFRRADREGAVRDHLLRGDQRGRATLRHGGSWPIRQSADAPRFRTVRQHRSPLTTATTRGGRPRGGVGPPAASPQFLSPDALRTGEYDMAGSSPGRPGKGSRP